MHVRTPVLAAVLFAVAGFASAQSEPLRVVAMPRDEGDVFDRSRTKVRNLDEGFLAEWRAIRNRCVAEGVKTLVLELTAADGDWATLKRLTDDFADLRANGIRIVVFVPEFAKGPAGLLALEADRILLSSGGSFGDADPTRISGATADGKSEETVIRETTAKALAAARRVGYPELFVEAVVDPGVEIFAVRRPGLPIAYVRADRAAELPRDAERTIVVRKGETLAIDAAKAESFGFPVGRVEDRDGLRAALGMAPGPLAAEERFDIKAKETGSSAFVGFDWSLALLALGILFLFLELKTPGLGVMGVLGVVCLSAYFLVNGGGGPDSLFSIGFLLVGFLLLIVEIVVLPGFGVAGILGIGLIVFSVYSATIKLPGTTLGEQLIPDSPADYARVKQWLVEFLFTLVFGAVGAFAAASQLARIPFLNRSFIGAPNSAAGASTDATRHIGTAGLPVEVGMRGVAESDLRPSGIARLSEQRVDVVADGEFVPRGTRVVVVSANGMSVVVRREDSQT